MNPNSMKTTFATLVLMLVTVCAIPTPSAQSTSPSQAKPLLLERNEGERRIWREPDNGDFMLKVSPKNNGSQHMVFGTEDMAPGDEFQRHRHLAQDEILWIEKGAVHVHLGDQERDLHAGGLAFIPAGTWVSVKNTGTETAGVLFAFSAPGFEDYMRCESVLPNEKPAAISPQRDKECEHLGHVIYQDLQQSPSK